MTKCNCSVYKLPVMTTAEKSQVRCNTVQLGANSQLLDFIWIPGCCCLPSLNQDDPSPSPSPACSQKQMPWQQQYKLPTNQKGVRYEHSNTSGVDRLGWSLEVPWFTEHVPSWPKQAEPGFPPKGTSFFYCFASANPCLSFSVLWLSTKTAATWQNALQPLHPCRHNTALCVQQDTHPVLSLNVLYSSHLHYWAEILKEKGFSFLQTSMNNDIYFLRAFH